MRVSPSARMMGLVVSAMTLALPVAGAGARTVQADGAGAAPAVAPAPAPAPARTILFVGNSFTYGGHSAAWKYRADTVTDLNGDGVGGVPALFKLFTVEAGLNYQVSLETSGGKTLEWHWVNKKALVDRAWDHVVLQDLSTFSRRNPGDPTGLIDYAGRFAKLFADKNPKVDISMTATWSRADQTYLSTGHWYGQPITRMALDVRAGYDAAKAANPSLGRIHPVGQVFNCAIETGVADANPYDGIAFGKVDLWTYDQYHASAAGYYLEALTIFVDITGKDPREFGKDEQAAAELGISPADAVRLQALAWTVAKGDGACPGAATAP